MKNPVPGSTNFRASLARPRASPAEARAAAAAFAARRKDLKGVVAIPQGFGRGVNWFFREYVKPPLIAFAPIGRGELPSIEPVPAAGGAAILVALGLGLLWKSKR